VRQAGVAFEADTTRLDAVAPSIADVRELDLELSLELRHVAQEIIDPRWHQSLPCKVGISGGRGNMEGLNVYA
jgi:hypothetical protein